MAAVVDTHSKVCVGWSMRNDLKKEIVIDALGMTATRKKPPAGCMHRLDQGSQYRSPVFGRTLRNSGVFSCIAGFYNQVRYHLVIGVHSPLEFEKMALADDPKKVGSRKEVLAESG